MKEKVLDKTRLDKMFRQTQDFLPVPPQTFHNCPAFEYLHTNLKKNSSITFIPTFMLLLLYKNRIQYCSIFRALHTGIRKCNKSEEESYETET